MTDEQLMKKMRKSAEEFHKLCLRKEYVRAINLYYKVLVVAVYAELSQENRDELFGNYIDNDETEIIQGLFNKDTVSYAELMAIKQEAERNRRGIPTKIHDFRN